MDSILVFIHHNGYWEGNIKYINFEVSGILLPKDSNYFKLLEIAGNELKIKRDDTMVEIKYQVKDGYPPLKIENDNNLQFYLELKKNEHDFTKYPLCIEVMNKENSLMLAQPSVNKTERPLISSNTMLEGTSTNCELSDNGINFVDFANLMSKNIVEKSTLKQQMREKNDYEESNVIENKQHREVEEGQVYKDKETLISVLSFYALLNHFQYKVKKSCNRQYFIDCLDDHCKWFLRASRCRKTSMFKIRKFNNIHTCPSEIRVNEQRQATSKIIGDYVKSKYVNVSTRYTPADIIRDVNQDFGINISYKKAWRSKEKAVEQIRGRPNESYTKIPSFLYMVKKTNPGSVVALETSEDNTFLYLFMALDASIRGWEFCRPVIVVDATFLKAACGGTLLTASTQDGDGKIFPLAFAIVDSKNDNAWEWFFKQIRSSLGVREGMCIISDKHESIEKATAKIYPEATHGVCIFHLLNNLKFEFKNTRKIKDSIIGAAKAYTMEQFWHHMGELGKIDERIQPYLFDIGYHKWSRVHSNNKRYFSMTSNMAESLNATKAAARELPVTTLLESLRSMTQDWSLTNRNIAKETSTKLTKMAENILAKNSTQSLKLRVYPTNEELFTVLRGNDQFVVDMKQKICSCNKFQMDELPCEHACAIIRVMKEDVYQYCSTYYTKDAMLATYGAYVYPIGNENTWDIPSEVRDQIVIPPKGGAKSGRSKKRFRSSSENHMKHKCGSCGQCGHNRKTCRKQSQK